MRNKWIIKKKLNQPGKHHSRSHYYHINLPGSLLQLSFCHKSPVCSLFFLSVVLLIVVDVWPRVLKFTHCQHLYSLQQHSSISFLFSPEQTTASPGSLPSAPYPRCQPVHRHWNKKGLRADPTFIFTLSVTSTANLLHYFHILLFHIWLHSEPQLLSVPHSTLPSDTKSKITINTLVGFTSSQHKDKSHIWWMGKISNGLQTQKC